MVNNSHYAKAGDLLQILADTVGIVTTPATYVTLAAINGSTDFNFHSQGTATGTNGLRLIPRSNRDDLTVQGAGGQWNISAGLMNFGSATNYRAPNDPVPMNPTNLGGRLLSSGNSRTVIVPDAVSDKLSIKNHNFTNVYGPHMVK